MASPMIIDDVFREAEETILFSESPLYIGNELGLGCFTNSEGILSQKLSLLQLYSFSINIAAKLRDVNAKHIPSVWSSP
jgi:hypothetical protein